MPKRTDLVLIYDGTFEGFLCCIFRCIAEKITPSDIIPSEAEQITLLPTQEVITEEEKAARVFASIEKKISKEAEQFVIKAFLSCLAHKEIYLLRFFRMGYRHGTKVMELLTNETMDTLNKAVLHCGREAYFFQEFLRFSIYGGMLLAVIEPKNYVLPLIREHYCDRYSGESFVIFDEVHKSALFYKPFEAKIVPVEHIEIPKPDADELEFRSLWKLFYDTIAIEGRYNPKCRMGHMPKRYWKNLTEFSPDTPEPPKRIPRRPLRGQEPQPPLPSVKQDKLLKP